MAQFYFITSWILAVQAWITQDANKKAWALQQGEKLLTQQALSHNHLMFYRYAIESCLDAKDFDKAQHFITALKRYTAKEPLPWSEFIIQRAKILIRAGDGEIGDQLENNFQELISEADQSGFIEAKASLLTALKQLQLSG